MDSYKNKNPSNLIVSIRRSASFFSYHGCLSFSQTFKDYKRIKNSGEHHRHQKSSTIIASHFPIDKWYEVIGESTVADAILNRLVHTSHRVELSGESMRKKKKSILKSF